MLEGESGGMVLFAWVVAFWLGVKAAVVGWVTGLFAHCALFSANDGRRPCSAVLTLFLSAASLVLSPSAAPSLWGGKPLLIHTVSS